MPSHELTRAPGSITWAQGLSSVLRDVCDVQADNRVAMTLQEGLRVPVVGRDRQWASGSPAGRWAGQLRVGKHTAPWHRASLRGLGLVVGGPARSGAPCPTPALLAKTASGSLSLLVPWPPVPSA